MRTTENPAYPLGKLVSAKHSVGLYHLALAMHPFGLDRVEPRALLGQKAAHDPHPSPALLDLSVVFLEPSSHLAAYVPGSVVPDGDCSAGGGRIREIRCGVNFLARLTLPWPQPKDRVRPPRCRATASGPRRCSSPHRSCSRASSCTSPCSCRWPAR